MAIINKSTNNKCWWGRGGRGPFCTFCWWECRLVQSLWKAVCRYLKKLKMGLSYDPVIPLLEIYPKNPKTLIQKNISTLMFIAALFTVAKIWKPPSAHERWIDKKQTKKPPSKLWYVCSIEYYSAVKKKKKKKKNILLTLYNSMNGPGEHMLSEISQSKKAKYYLISLICGT